jgi:tape measure domain-containing protein
MALTIRIRADATQFRRTIAGIEVQASGLTGVLGKLATSQAAFGAALAVAAAGAVALGAGLAFIKDASGKAAMMESLQVQFEVLTKSASKATELIQSFRDEAIKSPLSVSDYAQAGKTLMAFGISADQTLPILRTLGDVSMGNSERFGSLALAFAQTQAAGRLMGQEVLQFVNAGFNPLQEISRKTGRSMIELKKAMEDGAISAAMVTDAFRSATAQGGLFYGALDKGAATTEGKLAKLSDAMLGLKVAFGTGFNDGLRVALDSTNAFLPQLEGKFASAGKIIGTALEQAAQGNLETFAQIGILIGEAMARGFQDVTGNLMVEGMRSMLQSGSSNLSNEEKDLMNRDIDQLLGPKRSVSDRASDIANGLRDNMQSIEKSATPTWAETLKRQEMLTEELVRQGVTLPAELRKAFAANGLRPTSR